MSLNKKYLLKFTGKDKYGHKLDLPIVKLNLKNMDKFTTNYSDYKNMFDCMPKEFKKYVKDNLSNKINLSDNESLKKCFSIINEEYEIPILFYNDIDVTYITQKELIEKVISTLMSYVEIQKPLMKMNTQSKIKARYNFFSELYEVFAKDKEISKMMDTYDINKIYPKLSKDQKLIASIATDKDNLTVLIVKIGQNEEDKRKLAIMFKKMFVILNEANYLSEDKIRDRANKELDVNKIKNEILSNLELFKENYELEYK